MIAHSRPSYADLKARIESDLSAIPAVLRAPLAAAYARACHSQHGALDWIDAQCSPLTCELERLYDWAALYKVDRLLATAAGGTVVATGSIGAELLADTVLRGINGLDYTVSAAVTLDATSAEVSIRCATTGSAGNLVAGAVLTLVDPVAGIDMTLTVGGSGITGGAEDEDVDSWRARVADEWQTVTTIGARSGKVADYKWWSQSAHPSVTTALVQLHTLGIGSVVVRPICNGLLDRLPTSGVLDAVAAYLAEIAPATADWRVVAPLVNVLTVSIALADAIDTESNRAAIAGALEALVLSETGEAAVIGLAEIDAAIATVTSQYMRLAPTSDSTAGPGELFVLGPVGWV